MSDDKIENIYTYEKSRELFRNRVSKNPSFKLNTLYINEEDDLTIDIAVYTGNSKSLILHISGTHGVEGYVGSEIQTDLLKNIRIQNNTCYPTIIFVHGLNPFGMKYLRRVNENNVDLNRNALFQNEHKSLTDCSTSHRKDYSIIDNIINPKYKFSYSIFQKLYRFFKIIYAIIRYGFTRCKRAMVTGTYNTKFKKGLFYGGNKLEKSHELLRDFLEKHNYTENVKRLSLIDVHTGMGKMGKDTIMVASSNTFQKNKLDILFSKSQNVCYTHKDSKNEVTKGYELTKGDVADNYPTLFRNVEQVISVTQEFGTYHNLVVANELIKENQAWHYGSKGKEYDNRELYEVFSPLPNSPVRYEMMKRGILVFYKIFKNMLS